MHRQIRKAIKTRGHLPDEQAATKLHLPRHRESRNEMEVRPFLAPALTALNIHFEDRLPD
jgi:transposase-like protein